MAKISLNLVEPLKKWFVEKTDIITAWNSTLSDTQIPSEKLVKTELDAKINVSDRVTTIDATSSDVQVPSAKSVYTLYDSIPKWQVQVCESESALPTTGVLGTIYLVPESTGTGKNVYKEFFWNDKSSKYEQFGGVELDISNLVTMKQVVTYLGNNSTLALSDAGELSLTTTDPTE